jgi:hypothetical protein
MNVQKFNIPEMFSDSQTGKTSVTKVSGFFLVVVGAITFVYCVFFIAAVDRLNIILIQSLGVMTLGSGLLASKVFKPSNKIEHDEGVSGSIHEDSEE